jgi:transglutaminase-like putative cysteine protease
MHIRVGCEFRYEATWPTPTVMQVQPYPQGAHRVLQDTWQTTPELSMHSYHDIYGNLCQRFVLPTGENVLRYDALVEVADAYDESDPHAEQMPVESLPDDVLLYTLPSRFCLSDALSDTAWQLFGQTEPGWARVQAFCDRGNSNISFQ